MSSQSSIVWTISEVTPEITRKALSLQKGIEAACTIGPEDKSPLINFTYFLAATRKMTHPENVRPSVSALATFLEQWHDLSPDEVWRFHQEELSHKVKSVWGEAFSSAQELFDPDPAEVPDDALTDEQRAEAARPGSPLQ